jgi:2-hydroxy-3-oxopropionate reductase
MLTKDLGLALQSAKALGLSLPQTAGAVQLMQTVQAQGWDQLDHSALVKTFELMANHQLVAES